MLWTSQNCFLRCRVRRAWGIAPTLRPHQTSQNWNMPFIQVSGTNTMPTSNYRPLSAYLSEWWGSERGSGKKILKNAPIEGGKKLCGTIARVTKLSPLVLTHVIFHSLQISSLARVSFYFFQIFINLQILFFAIF